VAHSRNMTLEDLAASAGLSVTYLGQTERGQRNPSALVLWRIAGALGARLDQLVATDPDQPL
jgi:transcriptional regulator with XRE-family HTH domain